MRRRHWEIKFALFLMSLSAAVYGVHYLLFHNQQDILSNFLLFSAFVPVDVLLVVLIVHRLLAIHEKQAILTKLNMAIGVFYSEMGGGLLRRFRSFDLDVDSLTRDLVRDNDWTPQRFAALMKKYSRHEMKVDCRQGDLARLREFMLDKRAFLLGLLANPNLLEHDSFTDVLWAVFHLTEELASRADVGGLPQADCEHLAGDIKRAYGRLIVSWLTYMLHLKDNYPYLFSLAVRTNPFDPEADPVVR
jgi:hypothetical protein